MLYLAVGAGGIIGSLLRYYIGAAFNTAGMSSYPIGTLLVNYVGCFVLAWFTAYYSKSRAVPPWFRVGFCTGVIGSFTTFSTFSMDTVKYLIANMWLQAFIYILLSVWGGLFMVWSGYRLGLGGTTGNKVVK